MPSHRTIPRICMHCRSAFLARISEVNRGDAQYCSPDCQNDGNASVARAAERFWARVQKTPTCWLWTGTKMHHGYGVVVRRGTGPLGGKRRTLLTHRYAYELAYGPFSAELCVCHRCDMPLCVRPDHLFLGTRADNNEDKMRKGRHRNGWQPGEANGAAILTAEMVRAIRARYAAGGVSQAAVGRDFGISASAVYAIVNGIRWAHLK